jgi:hypothetical protein
MQDARSYSHYSNRVLCNDAEHISRLLEIHTGGILDGINRGEEGMKIMTRRGATLHGHAQTFLNVL